MIGIHDLILESSTTEHDLMYYLRELCNRINYDVSVLIVFNKDKSSATFSKLYIKDNINLDDKNVLKRSVLKKSYNSILEKIIANPKTIIVCGLPKIESEVKEHEPLIKGMKSSVYIPIIANKQENLIACIYLATADENLCLRLGDSVLKDIKIFTDNISSKFYELIIKDLLDSQFNSLLYFFSELINEKDENTIIHSYNVAYLAMCIGVELGLDDHMKQMLYIASILHDMGKIYIDKDLLSKSGKISENEYDTIKNHSKFGADIISNLSAYQDDSYLISEAIRYHHERVDGQGYPEKLTGDEIPLLSKIICVADSVDAMMSRRSYKLPMKVEDVIKELVRCSNKQFDEKIANIMIKILSKPNIIDSHIFCYSIMWCSAAIYTKGRCLCIQGFLTKENSKYIFKSIVKSYLKKDLETEVTKIELFIPFNMDILEFETKVSFIHDGIISITKLNPKKVQDAFAMLWYLKGYLVNSDFRNNVSIYKIGGSYLWFSIFNDLNASKIINKSSIVRVEFDDGTKVDLIGVVDQAYQIGTTAYFRLKYVNILESTRDKIYEQLFRRQAYLKRF